MQRFYSTLVYAALYTATMTVVELSLKGHVAWIFDLVDVGVVAVMSFFFGCLLPLKCFGQKKTDDSKNSSDPPCDCNHKP